jgi:hypothetical protein
MLRPYLAQSKHYLFSIITTQREGCNMREREREREIESKAYQLMENVKQNCT